MGINTRDRGRFSTGGIFHIRGGSVGFGTSLADGGKGDVLLYRKTTNELALGSGDSLTVPGSATVAGVIHASGDNLLTGIQKIGTGGTAIVIDSAQGGTVTWAEDVNLYWSAAGVLKTDDALTIADALDVGTTSTLAGDVLIGTGGTAIVIDSAQGGTITWAEDVNLYWSAAGILKTDDTLDASTGGVMTKLAAGAVAVHALANTGDVQLQFCGGTGRLIANVSGTVYFVNLTVKP